MIRNQLDSLEVLFTAKRQDKKTDLLTLFCSSGLIRAPQTHKWETNPPRMSIAPLQE